MQGNIPSGDVDISAVAEEWTKTVFVTADVIGILLKMFCVHKITQKCDLKDSITVLMIQYLIGDCILSLMWLSMGWFRQNVRTWLLCQEAAEILPCDLFQMCWAFILFIRVDQSFVASSIATWRRRTVCLTLWIVFVTSEAWKGITYLLLPAIWHSYNDLIGNGDDRVFWQSTVQVVIVLTPDFLFATVTAYKFLVFRRSLRQRCLAPNETLYCNSRRTDLAVVVIGVNRSLVCGSGLIDEEAERRKRYRDKSIEAAMVFSLVKTAVILTALLTPITLLQMLIITPCFSILNNFVIVVITVSTFGPISKNLQSMKTFVTRQCCPAK